VALSLRAVAVVLTGTLAGLTGACSEESVQEFREDVERSAEEAGARAVAEAIRAQLLTGDLGADEHARDVAVLENAVENLPGEPEITGIEDRDGDGRDDDGEVEVTVGRGEACIIIAENGDDIDVTDAGC
jgi:hypothetical protein